MKVMESILYGTVILTFTFCGFLIYKGVIKTREIAEAVLPLYHVTLYTKSGEVIDEWTGRYEILNYEKHITLFSGPYNNRQCVAVISGDAITIELVEEE